jgi:hypothetical protein
MTPFSFLAIISLPNFTSNNFFHRTEVADRSVQASIQNELVSTGIQTRAKKHKDVRFFKHKKLPSTLNFLIINIFLFKKKGSNRSRRQPKYHGQGQLAGQTGN